MAAQQHADMMARSSTVSSSSRRTLDEPSTDDHQALLTEHFGFHPRVFVDALVYAANEHLYSIGGQFEQFAKKQLKATVRKAAKSEREHGSAVVGSASSLAKMTSTQVEAEAERGVHAVLTLMENALDHIFDLLELYCLKTVFGIRPSQAGAITLGHHRGLDLRSADERVTDGQTTLTAEEESKALVQREAELHIRLEQARRMRNALRIANMTADRSLARTRKVAEVYGLLFEDEDGASLPTLNDDTPQAARKIRVDTHALVEALQHLSGVDPLGASLVQSDRRRALSDADKRTLLNASSAATETDRRAWERGREAYINWEMDRIIRNVRSRGAQGEQADQSMANSTFAHPASPSKSFIGTSAVSDGTKRRRTTARMSTAAVRTNEEHKAAQVGTLEEIEGLASIIGNKQ